MNIFTLALVAGIACTNCINGKIEVKCPTCKGSGVVKNLHRNKMRPWYEVACPKCSEGLYKDDEKGTGKISKTCPVCKGIKKVKIPTFAK